MTKFFAALLPVLMLSACTPRVGYVDPTKALNGTAEGKANIAALNAFSEAKRAEVASLRAEAAKEKDEDARAKKTAAAADLERKGQAELERRQGEGARKISEGLERILPKLRAAHGFSTLEQTPLDVDPSLEMTAELVRRYDAGEGAPPLPASAEVESLSKRVAQLESQKQTPPGLAKSPVKREIP